VAQALRGEALALPRLPPDRPAPARPPWPWSRRCGAQLPPPARQGGGGARAGAGMPERGGCARSSPGASAAATRNRHTESPGGRTAGGTSSEPQSAQPPHRVPGDRPRL